VVIPGLVMTNITMERSTMLLMGKLTISMAIFNSYVKLPEGRSNNDQGTMDWVVFHGRDFFGNHYLEDDQS